jgi:2-polyprenyl-3-methyl-5-hydroxy-6-metoxy-1,4-benzoquinol methylase
VKRDEQHYLSEQVDPLFISGARDFLNSRLRPARVLNLGLGYGVWDERLANDPRLEVTGVDLSRELVDRFSVRFPAVEYVCSDVFDYAPAAAFDTIVASHFLEHIADAVGLLRRMRGFIHPEGALLLVVPNAGSVHRQIGVRMGLIQQVTDLNDGDRMLGHQRVYTADLLRSQFEQSGAWKIDVLRGVTLKALSNAQLAALPRAYVDACCTIDSGIDDLACQLAVAARPA